MVSVCSVVIPSPIVKKNNKTKKTNLKIDLILGVVAFSVPVQRFGADVAFTAKIAPKRSLPRMQTDVGL